MIVMHYSFKNVGSMVAGLHALSDIALSEGCQNADEIQIDGANFGSGEGRLTLCKKLGTSNQAQFHIEVGPTKDFAKQVPDLPPDAPKVTMIKAPRPPRGQVV